MIIEGLIRTKGKIHLTSALDDAVKINSSGQINAPDARIPLSRTYRTAAFTSQGRIEIPFFPANSWVGRLRRAVTEVLSESLISRQEQITRTTYRGLSCGAADAKPEMGGLNVDEFEAYLKHPFIGLFGGGKRLYESAYKMFDTLPIMQATIDSGMVPADYADQMAMLSVGENNRAANRVTGIDILHRRDDLLEGRASEEVVASISDFDELQQDMRQEAARKVQAAALRAGVKKGDDETKESRASMAQQSAREYICPGVPMYFRTAFKKRIRDEQFGLFLIALQAVFNENAFGGVSHLGYGELNLSDAANNLMLHESDLSAPLFELQMKAGSEALVYVHPRALECVQKAKTWIDSVTNAELETFYIPSVAPSQKDDGEGEQEETLKGKKTKKGKSEPKVNSETQE